MGRFPRRNAKEAWIKLIDLAKEAAKAGCHFAW
jgi:hypothetical protein